MTLWLLFVPLLLLALAFVAWPIFRQTRRLSVLLASVIVFVVALSAGLYHRIGEPGIPSGAGSAEEPDIAAMVAGLAARLEKNPGSIKDWTMLGRSYMNLREYDKSIAAYDKAIDLEQGRNAQTLVDLAIVFLAASDGAPSDRATDLLENAVAIAPNDPNALFYSGIAAAERGNTDLAADRWEVLLGLNAPPKIRAVLQEKIDLWRGVTAPVAAATESPPEEIVRLQLSVSKLAREALPADASVFIIARDPQQPSPPIAVTRRRLSELPMEIVLTDGDSMVPGRSLSAFQHFELIARVSVSGQPLAQAGDWYGSLLFTVQSNGDNAVDLVIDRQLP